jgi:Tfp pilus assembly PilM family ATPase
MIKNIFLPEKIGESLIFAKRVVGVDIQKTHLFATIVFSKGITQTVEKCIEIPIEQFENQSDDPKVAALIELKKRAGNCAFHTQLSSTVVVYKELTFPFADRQKIELVLKYEIEPLLPFAAADVIIDFMITKIDQKSGKTTVLVACVQKQHLAEHLALFASAGIAPDVVTVDLFGLYGLYTYVYDNTITQTSVLLDLGMYTTKIAYIQEGTFTMVRVLNQGILQLLKNAAEKVGSTSNDLFDTLLRFDITTSQENHFIDAFKQTFVQLVDNVRFTLTSYGSKELSMQPSHIIIYGPGGKIAGINKYIESLIGIPTTYFTLADNSKIHFDSVNIPLDRLYSLGSAVWAPCNEYFTLLREDFARKDLRLFVKQFCVSIVSTVCLICLLVGLHITQINKLKSELDSSTQEVVDALKQQFTKIPKDETNLDEIIDLAHQAINTEKELWFAFSYANQSRFLHYLLELTYKIDKDALGFEPEKITITEGTLILKARVKDYDALKVLERELKSSRLFSHITPQDNPQFTMQITLAPTQQEAM